MCLMPIRASRQEVGRPKFTPEGEFCLPCGKCHECIKKRATEWALRAKHELALHSENCFLTLTYDQEHLPSNIIIKDDFQNFLKRLRKSHKLRYMVSYEYGTKTFRPHMHAIIFGYSPTDQKFLKNTKKGYPLFTSNEISKLWKNGFHSIAEANTKTAYYIASYALKGKKHEIIHPGTGETILVSDSMDCSKKPAIGLQYFQKNYQQLINTGESLPRYYLKKLENIDTNLLCEYENKQQLKSNQRSAQQIYSKNIIDTQKTLMESEYRENSIDLKYRQHYSAYLKSNRDDYVSQTKGKK